jgi:NAD-dependent deacetylase
VNFTQAGSVAQAAKLIGGSTNSVAFTGAGISTPSGIPDFRGRGSGLWSKADPMAVASLHGFQSNPEHFYDWLRPLARLMIKSEPNPAHCALAQLEQHGLLEAVITQNIDLLHTRAGSQVVHEVHGHIREATCSRCGRKCSGGLFIDQLVSDGPVPSCPQCDGVLKPDVVLFDELLPEAVMLAAQHAAMQCDLMLVAGSSLEVYPAADLPALTKRCGGSLIIVNFDSTHLDNSADVLIRGDVAEVLPAIADQILDGE